MDNIVANIAKLYTRKGVITSRIERIKREGSPAYVYALPVTAPAAIDVIHVPQQFPLSRKYQPLDSLEVVNNSVANPVTIIINGAGNDTYLCPAGTIRSIRGSGVALWQIETVNNGVGATVLGEIILTCRKEAMTIDKWAANQ